MAYYTFVCQGCGERFEARCTIEEKDKKLVRCPKCGGNELKREYGGFAVSVKSAAPSCPNQHTCPHAGGCSCGR